LEIIVFVLKYFKTKERMMILKAKDIMTSKIAYVDPKATVIEAAQLMQKHNVGSIPVCDNSGVVGILTDRDIVVRNVASGVDPRTAIVKDVMTVDITTVNPNTEIDDITNIMSHQQIRRIPVVDNNKLVGMIALGDVAVNTNTNTDLEVSEALADISTPARPANIKK
jgi:CBS domain-containing protein